VNGAIAAGDPQTAAAARTMLELGGNAVDAAVAASFASFIAEAALVNIGGGGVALVVDSHSDRRLSYDFFSNMPSKSIEKASDFREVIIDFGPEQQPFYIGRASVAVPGVVAGLCAMAAEHGTLPLSTILTPAIKLAESGATFMPGQAFAYTILQPIFTATPEIAALFRPNGRLLEVGDTFRFPALAETLKRLGVEGRDLFYRGDVAEAILDDQRQNGGLLTPGDLADYHVYRLAPIEVDYRGNTILLPPPSSAGGVLVGFALKLMAAVELGSTAHSSPEHLRLLAEVMRLTNVARRDWDANRALGEERIGWFLSEQHVDVYRRRLRAILNGATPPVEPPAAPAPNNTTHVSVVDQSGLLASITTSAGENAGFTVGDTGVCLNNMLGEHDLHPDGFHRLPAGERLSTMMTPAIVVRDGEPVLAVGSGGSNRIRSAILQVLSNLLDFDMALETAVGSSRVHFESDTLQVEGGITTAAVGQLRDWGYQVNHWSDRNMFFGGAHAVAMQDGELIPVGDLRRGGSAEIVMDTT
jgi:gamma-glutamyltranspeptidase/glutathione hydrolase